MRVKFFNRFYSDKNASYFPGLLDTLFRNYPSAIAANLINALLLVTVLWLEFPTVMLLAWFGLVLLLSAVRYFSYRHYTRQSTHAESRSAEARFQNTLLVIACMGLLWGAAGILFYREGSLVYQAFLGFVLAGTGAGAVSTLSSVRFLPQIFITLVLSPYLIRMILEFDMLHVSMAVMIIMLQVVLMLSSRNFYTVLVKSLKLSEENVAQRKAIEHSAMRTQAILDNTADGILTLSESGRIVSVNPALLNIFHTSSGKMNLHPFTDYLHVDYQERFKKFFKTGNKDAIQMGREYEVIAQRPDGSECPIEILFSNMQLRDQIFIL